MSEKQDILARLESVHASCTDGYHRDELLKPIIWGAIEEIRNLRSVCGKIKRIADGETSEVLERLRKGERVEVVDRLREMARLDVAEVQHRSTGTTIEQHTCWEAADEIERLRSLCGAANLSDGFRDMLDKGVFGHLPNTPTNADLKKDG